MYKKMRFKMKKKYFFTLFRFTHRRWQEAGFSETLQRLPRSTQAARPCAHFTKQRFRIIKRNIMCHMCSFFILDTWNRKYVQKLVIIFKKEKKQSEKNIFHISYSYFNILNQKLILKCLYTKRDAFQKFIKFQV